MNAKHAKDVARRWVIEEAVGLPGFCGAFYHGSVNGLPDDAELPATSDLDVMVVLAGHGPEQTREVHLPRRRTRSLAHAARTTSVA